MGDVPIKFTLTTNERQALEGVQKMDAALDSTTNAANAAAKAIGNVEKAMAQASRSMGFQGSASTTGWLNKTLGEKDPGTLSYAQRLRLERSQQRAAEKLMDAVAKPAVVANRRRIADVFVAGEVEEGRLASSRRWEHERVRRLRSTLLSRPGEDLIAAGASQTDADRESWQAWDGGAHEQKNRRSNRRARIEQIRQEESREAAWIQDSRMRDGSGRVHDGYGGGNRRVAPPSSVAGGIARAMGGVGDIIATAGKPLLLGAYFAEQFAAGFQQKMGTDYFQSLLEIEPRYRPLMGLDNNAANQAAVREMVRNKAVAVGMDTNVTSSVIGDIQAAAGTMSKADRKQLVNTTLGLYNVGGGDPNTLASGLLSFQGIFGAKTGGIARAGALFKAAADDAKFSPTTLAQLGPDAFSFLAMYGYSPEESLAMMVAPSNKTGRPENFFTGLKYVASEMGAAEEAGWVDEKDSLRTKLDKISKRSPKEVEGMFGREGFSAIMNLVATRGDVDFFRKKYQGVQGGMLARQEMQLLSDPVNMFSRLAKSVDVTGGQGYELLMEQGGPEGSRLAGKALTERLAMEGQKLDNPIIASLTDKTKSINLQIYKQKYTSLLLPHMIQAMTGDGPAGALKAQALKLMTGQVQLDSVDPLSTQGLKNAFGNIGEEVVSTRASDGADAADYLKMVREQRLFGMTAEEYGQYITLKNGPSAFKAESFRSSLVQKYSRGDMNFVGVTAASADDLAARSALAGRDGPYASITGPIDDYIDALGTDAGSSIRAKAATTVRSKLYSQIINHQKAKGTPHEASWWRDIQQSKSSFASDVDKVELGLLQGAFGTEYQKRANALETASPNSSGFEGIKSKQKEISDMAAAMYADGAVSKDELSDAVTKLGINKASGGETDISQKSIEALAAALAKVINAPSAETPTTTGSGTPRTP